MGRDGESSRYDLGMDENGNIFADGTRQKGKSMDRAVPTDHKSLRACVFLLTFTRGRRSLPVKWQHPCKRCSLFYGASKWMG